MSKKKLLAAALFAAVSSGMVASALQPVLAADSTTDQRASQTKQDTTAQDKAGDHATGADEFVKVSDDARMTMHNVRAARLAIFDGQPDQAQTFLDTAVARAAATIKDADQYAMAVKEQAAGDQLVPFGASLTVLDTFVPTAEKMKHIAKANEHLRKGEKQQAMEVLKLAEVDVAVATKLVPVQFARQHIEDADKLVSEGKYYEANLALKAIEDAVVIESVAVDAVPETAKGHS